MKMLVPVSRLTVIDFVEVEKVAKYLELEILINL